MTLQKSYKISVPFILLFCWHNFVFATNEDSLFKAWGKALETDDKNIPAVVYNITNTAYQSLSFENFLSLRNDFGKVAAAVENPELKLRYNILSNSLAAKLPNRLSFDSLYKEFAGTLRLARLQENNIMVACTCMTIGALALLRPEIDKAFFYVYQSIQLKEQIGSKYFPDMGMSYYLLATASFNSEQFRGAIDYGIKAISFPDTSATNKASMCNVIGLGYQRLKIYDSAFYWYQKGRDWCSRPDMSGTLGMIIGNEGISWYEKGKYDLALPLLKTDFTEGARHGDWGNVCNSMQWAARIYLAQGKIDSAINYLHFTFNYTARMTNVRYKRNIYEAAVAIYKRAGMPDSAWFYNDSVKVYSDSLKVAIERSKLSYVKTQIDYQNSMQEIDNLKKQRETEVLKRNVAIGLVLLSALSALLFWNRKKMQISHRQQLLQKEKEAAEREAINALDRLKLTTQNLVDKNSLIEKLQEQLTDQQLNHDLQEKIDLLREEVILTDEDWARYRSTFERVHPGFLKRLKNDVADISLAEQRIAALIRLSFDNKQMAAILGISSDSVAKSKRRLRHRLNLEAGTDLEAYIAKI
ncbi:MAG TPA: hypothetical protein PKM63_02885 [Panacibacter sp.]|nr:hypothetical protein [Panacibacter sp.]HNP43203.1 hypothetical protein [Panacibacter sp.]